MKIKLPQLICRRCKHAWTPRKTPVYLCPKCHSPKWNEPKTARPRGQEG